MHSRNSPGAARLEAANGAGESSFFVGEVGEEERRPQGMWETTLTREQSREVDRLAIQRFAVPGVVLMENAGRGATEQLLESSPTGPVAICCGKGNNGGDGFVIARHLDLHGIPVRVLLWADPAELGGDAAINYRILEASGISITVCRGRENESAWRPLLAEADWIVDALLGTGFRGSPRDPFGVAIQAINAASAAVLAVDLPSGLDCDSGEAAADAVRADRTCTFVAAKRGFLNLAAGEYLGTVHVIHIGAPRTLIETIRQGPPNSSE
ncbi:MAG: NAD(P)H-hydrate epimerase [Planctomycetales bacterium]